MDVGFDGAHRAFDDQLDADRRRQMEHHVAFIDHLGDHVGFVDAVKRIAEARMIFEMLNVLHAAGGQIVEDMDLIAAPR